MNTLNPSDFSREEIRKRMTQHAASIWQMRGKDVEAADPLVSYLMEACAFELENTAQAIEQTRGRIVDRLASVMCPDVVDLPRPAHAIFHARSDDALADLAQSAQFYYRPPLREGKQEDYFFSPAVKSRVVNGDVRFLVSEQGIAEFSGSDRMQWDKQVTPSFFTDYQSVWIGIELDQYVPAVAGLPIYFDWETESVRQKAVYYRKLQDQYQSKWFLNGQPLSVHAGFVSPDSHAPHLGPELDVLHQLEQEVMNLYHRSFVTLGNVPGRDEWGAALSVLPPGFQFTEQQRKVFDKEVLWLELRLSRDFPMQAVATMDVRLNCFPVMNRYLNRLQQRLFQTLNVFPLKSEADFLFIRRVYDADSKELFRSSPLRDVNQLEENSFMWRPHDVGRFDERNARDLLQHVQQLLLDENRAFRALGSGWFVKTLDELNRSLEDLRQQLQAMPNEGFKTGSPYAFIKPRKTDSNLFIEFWSTNGKAANFIPAGTFLAYYGGYDSMQTDRTALFLVTATVGGYDKLSTAEKEYQLRQTLLSRQRLVTIEDIQAECKAYFFARLGGVAVDVRVEKAFAENLIEGAGYVRCLDVTVTPRGRTELTSAEWEAECDRCRQYMAERSAMNLPYRVSMQSMTNALRPL
ncbi:type VI secretion system baseplate subunit TssF [Fibrella forsythiae]|uniref:Type VI secretion system baseplate subunit TssF n=1 Tax=Fibrella forsythiae TaxID=2817061 RepID=A0ABS3JGJ5_9BACT|nr:type VI secretion system baseplate subunit TssF [Fibrella forsythiae]MBO0949133.1 type VI secretion system baseplate subunit TssF [Fibrella forsythiae]